MLIFHMLVKGHDPGQIRFKSVHFHTNKTTVAQGTDIKNIIKALTQNVGQRHVKVTIG